MEVSANKELNKLRAMIGLVAMVAFAIIVVLTIWLVISARNRAKDEF